MSNSFSVTTRAAEELASLLRSRQASPDLGLRLSVSRGGCAGMNYVMEITTPAPHDVAVSLAGANIFLDPASRPFLDNAQLDFVDDLSDSGFRVVNPNAARSCGCGTSFEPAQRPSDLPAYDPALDGTTCASADLGQGTPTSPASGATGAPARS